MYNEFFNTSQEQFDKMAAPVRKFNNATLDYVSKLVEYQISMFRSYSEISIEQMRALQTVTDPKSLQAYVGAQAEATKSLGEKVAKDANELVELQRGYAEEVQKLSEEGLATVTSIDPAKARKSA
ncbi:phasin family protein [Ectothiorhodospira lacustris]|uniref:phasin family protein n=1 Tax=Ectothiorhodospira lacustris TaxID=2899127 RepID=UPI001EE8D290|nr:phasin family protein [Ectothiorhodospira lacustris]MCG5501384.1 phasin family protein [Ectothiorhodospira lacustris]MCG5510160.1 phasin family protein [Ectothiorhodospira lacustris]MCG5522003.1 phasin family protein [Ectothiorhodospira lacustris]